MSEQKLFYQNIFVKVAKNRYKSAQTNTECWFISLKFGPQITCHILNLGFTITSGIPVASYV